MYFRCPNPDCKSPNGSTLFHVEKIGEIYVLKMGNKMGDFSYKLWASEGKLEERGSGCHCPTKWIKVGKPKKTKPAKFVVIYDETDGDPAETFKSRTELNKWLKEAKDDENIVWNSIKVFEVKKEMEVLTSFRLKTK